MRNEFRKPREGFYQKPDNTRRITKSKRLHSPASGRGKTKKAAFTLAETLITIAIIGIIAALTVPNLLRKYQNHQFYVALKDNYSILSNAYKLAITENGPFDGWTNLSNIKDRNVSTQEASEPIMKYIKYNKVCTNETGCWAPSGTWYLNKKSKMITDGKGFGGNPRSYKLTNGANITYTLRTWANGADMSYYFGMPTNGPFMSAYVDVNGDAGPNILGRDTWAFVITKDALLPGGSGTNTANCMTTKTNSNQWGQVENYAGGSCTFKVLQEGRINY